MKYKKLVCLAVLLIVLSGCAAKNQDTSPSVPVPEPSVPEKEAVLILEEAEESEPTIAEPEPEQAPEPEPTDKTFLLSFAGDCTLGTEHEKFGYSGTFVDVVGNHYDYPLQNCREYFENDDFTMVNLEGALTNSTNAKDKTYRFRGYPEYAKILSGSGVECVSLANNHSGDFGTEGLEDTKAALAAEGVHYIGNGGSFLYECERGLKIGICAYFGGYDGMKKAISSLKENGAQIVVVFFHWGNEGYYTVAERQTVAAHKAIDAGANLVVGCHPHVLEPIESYKNGVICYSMGNFCFGGNRNPTDKDTCILQQAVTVTANGEVLLGDTTVIPFCLSSTSGINDYCPKPYEDGTKEYDRVIGKMNGTIVPAPLVREETPEENVQESEAVPDSSPEQPPAEDAVLSPDTPEI